MIKFVKTFKVEFPVWVDGQPTAEKETRIKALFVKEVLALNGLVSRKQYGSLVLNREVTEEDAAKGLKPDTDYSSELAFEAVPGSDFYKVRAL